MKQLLPKLAVILLVATNATGQINSLIDKDCDLPCVNKTFQVHLHLVQDSLGNTTEVSEIQESLDYTSMLFAPICIDFAICAVDSIRDYSFDSIPSPEERMELTTRLQRANRINIYVFNHLDNDNNPDNDEIAGLGGGGIVWITSGAGGETMAHEMGHVFGLLHTFEEGDELVNGSNCETAGDLVCDTPADPYVENSDTTWLAGCEFVFAGRDANGELYQPQTGNTMSYHCGGCGFTKGQLLRMVETMNSSALKNW